MATYLFVNDCIAVDDVIFRLLHIGPLIGGFVYAINLDTKNPLPQKWSREEFDSPPFRKRLKKVEPPPERKRPLKPSTIDNHIQDERWRRIRTLVKDRHLEVLNTTTRMRVLKDHAQTVGCTPRTLLADLRLWWLGGQNQSALQGSYFRCGHIDEATPSALPFECTEPAGKSIIVFAPSTEKARGRPPRINAYDIFSIPRDLRRIIARRAATLIKLDETCSQRWVSDKIAEEMFCVKDANGDPVPSPDDPDDVQLLPKGMRPTKHQIRYIVRRVVPPAEAYRRRVGNADFLNNHAPASGSVLDATNGPADVYEIDATIVDVWIVAKADRKTIIGKATLYLVLDRYSRLVVGFHLSLENPSWCEARLAILSTASNWEQTCARLGVKYDERDWPAVGVEPNQFLGDRGEMNSFLSDVVSDGLRIPVANPPALLSQRKSIVECGFRLIHVPLKDNAPGYEPPSNAKKRRGKHYDKDACLTLDELAALLLRAVIAYNKKAMAGFPLSPTHVLQKVIATPIAIWNLGIEELMGSRPRHTYDFMKFQLMPSAFGVVKVDGIHFADCIYEFDDPVCRSWQSRASLRKAFEVVVIHNPALVDQVIVVDPNDSSKQFVAHLVSDYKRFMGYSAAEVHFIAKEKQSLDGHGEDLNEAGRVNLARSMGKVIDHAREETEKVTEGIKLASRLRNSDDVRDEEAAARRRQTHRLDGSGPIYDIGVSNLTANAQDDDFDVQVAPHGNFSAESATTPCVDMPIDEPESPADTPEMVPDADAALMNELNQFVGA